jgi:HlyD family secretion protein
MNTVSVTTKSFYVPAKAWVFAHKGISALIAIALLSGVYGTVKASGTSGTTQYVLGTASLGNINETVSGSGQISASNEVSVQSKASGPITSVNVKVGQAVRAGQQLAAIDPGDAGLQLQSARLSYNDLVTVKPTDLQKAQNTVTQDQDALTSSYTSARSTIVSSVITMTNTINTLHDLLTGSGYLSNNNPGNYVYISADLTDTQNAFHAADSSLLKYSQESQSITDQTDSGALNTFLSDGYATGQLVADAAKKAQHAAYELHQLKAETDNQATVATAAYTKASDAANAASTATVNMLSAQQSIKKAENALAEARSSLGDVKTGPAASSVSSSAVSVREKELAYNNFFVTAPFAGVVAKVDAKVGDTVSSGAAIATVITKNKIATVSLNEVDAAKVKAGDKVTLTFDAIDGLTIIGTVDEIDLVGTVTSGVVSYSATVTLDIDDSRIQSGMTVNADIITNSAQNVVTVPSSAIKTQGGTSYVLVVDAVPGAATSTTSVTGAAVTLSTAPRMAPVTTGISDNTNTEIASGLTNGETIVVRTTTGTAAAAATTRTSAGAIGGAARPSGGGGGGLRAFGG